MALVLGSCSGREPTGGEATITVFAAASAGDVMREAGRRYAAETGAEIVLSADASSRLARQILAGAPADVFLSASREWMDHLEASGAIRADTRRDLVANELVLVAPAKAAPFAVEMTRAFDFADRLPGVGRIAVGDPAHVPAGRYARQALEALGWWDDLEPRLIPALDARAALRLVESGETDAGIVYASDAARSDEVRVLAAFPPDTHEPIRYPIALCADSERGAAFIEFLGTSEVQRLFEEAGFRVLVPAPAGDG